MTRRKQNDNTQGIHVARDLTVTGKGNAIAGRDLSQYIIIDRLVLREQREDGPPNLLPPDAPDFGGRDDELHRLISTLIAPSSSAVKVSVISGQAGVGKSALAVHVAHALTTHLPDGQLYVDLLGADKQPLTADEALTDLLYVGLGVPWEDQPDSLPGKAAMWRRLLARGNRVLVLLDNAHSDDQVRPLLPGVPSCAVLVTSRRVLAGLGGDQFPLHPLSADQGLAMLAVAGRKRVMGDRDAALAIVGFCGGLPLALRIAGARLVARPDWSLEHLAERLSEEHRRLSELGLGDLSVQASLRLSYQALTAEPSNAFRLLALWPGSDFEAWVVAALLDCRIDEAENVIDSLVSERLVEPAAKGRFKEHDLVRLFARQVLGEPAPEARQAQRRMLDSAAQLSQEMDAALRQDGQVISSEAALRWFEDERTNMVATVTEAVRVGQGETAWKLASSLRDFLDRRGYKGDMTKISEAVVAEAERSGDAGNLSDAYYDLFRAYDRECRWDEAKAILHKLLALIRRPNNEAEDRYLSESNCLAALSHVYEHQDRHEEAKAALNDSLTLLRQADDRHHEAMSLAQMAVINERLGQLLEAEENIATAIAISRELGHDNHLADALEILADIRVSQSRPAEAEQTLQDALSLYRALGDTHSEAGVLHRLGHLLRDIGNPQEAEDCLNSALAIFRSLSDLNCERNLLSCLGHIYQTNGRLAEAQELLIRALTISHDIDDIRQEIEILGCLEALASKAGEESAADGYRQRMTHAKKQIPS